jgi:uncharacterized protein (DUF58 family)
LIRLAALLAGLLSAAALLAAALSWLLARLAGLLSAAALLAAALLTTLLLLAGLLVRVHEYSNVGSPIKNEDMHVTFRLEALHATRAPVPVNYRELCSLS